jgi:Domain of unknown function (DUF4383)
VRHRPPIQLVAALAGVALLLLGVLGLVPGITTHYDRLGFAGHSTRAELFGRFRVGVLHDLVHIALGLTGLALARTVAGARAYVRGAGVALLGLWLLGVADAAAWLPVNAADNWLHLVLGAMLLAAGVVAERGRAGLRPAPA